MLRQSDHQSSYYTYILDPRDELMESVSRERIARFGKDLDKLNALLRVLQYEKAAKLSKRPDLIMDPLGVPCKERETETTISSAVWAFVQTCGDKGASGGQVSLRMRSRR